VGPNEPEEDLAELHHREHVLRQGDDGDDELENGEPGDETLIAETNAAEPGMLVFYLDDLAHCRWRPARAAASAAKAQKVVAVLDRFVNAKGI
jgi:hypothetical protein